MMYAGGPGGDPYMGLLGTISPLAGNSGGLLQAPQQQMQMPAMMQSYQPQGFGASPGTNWSQVAYQNAGSPNQNPFRGSVLPPATTAASSPASGGATALGSTALGILGALGKAAGTNTNLGNAITGLLGGSGNSFGTYTAGNIANVGNVAGSGITNAYAPATAQYTSGLMGSAADAAGTSGIAPVGTGAVDAAADAGASAAIPGLEGGADAASAGGLLGGDTAAAAASPALETVGTGAVDAAADAGAASGAADSAASTAGLGAGLGAAAAAAPFAAILGKMLLDPDDVMLKAPYWQTLGNSLKGAGTNVNTGPGGGGAAASQYAISDAVQEALNVPQSQVPAAIQQQVWATGLVPYGTWGFGSAPTPGAGTGGISNVGAHRSYWE